MRVLHLISGGDSGGAKTQVISLVSALERYIDVKIVCFMAGDFYHDAVAQGLDVELLAQGARQDLRVLRPLARLIEEGGFQVIHAHGARANFIAWFLRKRIHLPFVTTLHSDYLRDFEGNLYKQLFYTALNSFALRGFDYYITVSDRLRDLLTDRGFSPDRILTVRNGIDFAKPLNLKGRQEVLSEHGLASIPTNALLVGYVARFHPVKGHRDFLKGAAQLLQKRDDLHFLLAGDGDQQEEMQRFCQELGIGSNVHFLGFVRDVDALMNILDVNVLTSHTDTFPYVLLEGARLRKATVTSDVGDVGHMIHHGESGFVFAPGQVEDFAGFVMELLDNAELRRSFGDALYNHVKGHFSLEAMASNYHDIYQRVIEKHRQRTEEKASIIGPTDRPPRIVVSGYYGFGNSGDEAILSAIVKDIHQICPGAEFTALSNAPALTARQHQISAVHRMKLPAVLARLRQADLLISGGGSLLQDATSTRSLLYYLTLIVAAKGYGAKVMMYANGVGPLRRPSNRRLAARVVESYVDLATLREENSAQVLREIGVEKTRTVVTADPVFSTEPVPEDRVDEILKAEGLLDLVSSGTPVVGISIRSWAKNDFVAKVAAFADAYSSERGAHILYIPMQHRVDLPVIEEARQLMGERSYVLRGSYTAAEVIGIAGRLQWMLVMRLHMLIYAAIAGTPAAGLVYDPKVANFLELLGLPVAGHVNDVTVEGLMQGINEIEKDAQNIRRQLEETGSILKDRARDNARLALSLLE